MRRSILIVKAVPERFKTSEPHAEYHPKSRTVVANREMMHHLGHRNAGGFWRPAHLGESNTHPAYPQVLRDADKHCHGGGYCVLNAESSLHPKTVIAHERTHEAQASLDKGDPLAYLRPKAIRDAESHPMWDKASKHLKTTGYAHKDEYVQKLVHHAEIPAMLAGGTHKEHLGLDDHDAADLALHYASVADEHHGTGAAAKLFKHTRPGPVRKALRDAGYLPNMNKAVGLNTKRAEDSGYTFKANTDSITAHSPTGQTVGHLMFSRSSPSAMHIDTVHTHPDHRGKGVGNGLYRALKSHLLKEHPTVTHIEGENISRESLRGRNRVFGKPETMRDVDNSKKRVNWSAANRIMPDRVREGDMPEDVTKSRSVSTTHRIQKAVDAPKVNDVVAWHSGARHGFLMGHVLESGERRSTVHAWSAEKNARTFKPAKHSVMNSELRPMPGATIPEQHRTITKSVDPEHEKLMNDPHFRASVRAAGINIPYNKHEISEGHDLPVYEHHTELPPVKEGHTRIYHGTWKKNIPGIAKHGLLTGREAGKGEQIGEVLATHSPHNVFGDASIVADVPHEHVRKNGDWLGIRQSIPRSHIVGVLTKQPKINKALLIVKGVSVAKEGDEETKVIKKPQLAVDFDGTLATHTPDLSLGKPVLAMVSRVKAWLAEGKGVVIFTARVSPEHKKKHREKEEKKIQAWCEHYIGQRLPVTASKAPHMVSFYDDRAVQVKRNTGEIVKGLIIVKKAVELLPPPARNRVKHPYQGTIIFQGIKIAVENKKGSKREISTGEKFPMRHHYGEIIGVVKEK
jgi:ribosomal protein S18 acetylase RimI-like enzyme